MLEFSKDYSVGRGTDAPFEILGGAFVKGPQLAEALNRLSLPGVRVYPTRFTPAASKLAGAETEGIRIVITDRNAFRPTEFGLHLMAALQRLYPGKILFDENRKLIGDPETIRRLQAGEAAEPILASWRASLDQFLVRRSPYLIYP
jgi:uncharacterized protein YbbC (DUF1343 family)